MRCYFPNTANRAFWIAVRSVWFGWCGPLTYVHSDTVVQLVTRAGSAGSGPGCRNHTAASEAGQLLQGRLDD
jgi:hypothetical protein